MENDYYKQLAKFETEKEAISNRIALFKKYEYLYEYFLPVKNMRNPYLVSMRIISAFRMFKDGMIQNDIASILSRDHASINHIFGKETVEDGIYYEVLENLDKWIDDKVYPLTKRVHVRKKDQKHDTDNWRLIYKLKPI
jgi:hypothetical protein